MIDEPNEALNGECEFAACMAPICCGPPPPCCAGPAAADDEEPPLSAPNGSDGDMEKVEPPKLNEAGAEPLEKRPPCEPDCWSEFANESNGDWDCCGWLACCCCCCCDCGGLNRLKVKRFG